LEVDTVVETPLGGMAQLMHHYLEYLAWTSQLGVYEDLMVTVRRCGIDPTLANGIGAECVRGKTARQANPLR
jgi:hypothetical protein